jgi:hypothetical protein
MQIELPVVDLIDQDGDEMTQGLAEHLAQWHGCTADVARYGIIVADALHDAFHANMAGVVRLGVDGDWHAHPVSDESDGADD